MVTNTDPYDLVNPHLSATNSFTVVVREVNVAPVLPVIPDQTVNELTLLTVTNTASETNIHATLGYTLVNPPAGAAIDANGVITWTPSQNQSPGTNTITTVVTNTDAYDLVNPHLSATNSFTVVVREVNVAPVLPVIPNQTVNELTLLTVTNTAFETNIHRDAGLRAGQPARRGRRSMPTASSPGRPPDAESEHQHPHHGGHQHRSLRRGQPAFERHQQLHGRRPGSECRAGAAGHSRPDGQRTDAADRDQYGHRDRISTPPSLGYTLVNPPAGATINASGIFTWTPSQNQSPGTNTITTVVTNANPYDLVNPNLTATNSFTVIVREVNVAPVLPIIPAQTINELTLLTVTNTATNSNIHSTIVGYALVNPPAGAAINASGVFTWTPSQNQSPGTNTITTVVTNANPYDLINPNLTATNSFTVIVREVNVAPALPVNPTQTVSELTLLTVTNTATNANIHSTIVGYALVNPPAGAAIDANGIFTWTPSQNQSPGTNTITTVVTNANPYDLLNPNLTATNSFTVVVREVNVAPAPAGHSHPDGQRVDAADGDQHGD